MVGSVKLKVLPVPSVLDIFRVVLCASRMFLLMLSPSPIPGMAFFVAFEVR